MVVLDRFFFIYVTKNWRLVALDWGSSYTVTIVMELCRVDSAMVVLDKWLSYRGCHISRFDCIPKITSANICKIVYNIINYSTFICPFEFLKCGKEGKKLQKIEYLESKKSFFDEMKNIFIVFERLTFDEKK